MMEEPLIIEGQVVKSMIFPNKVPHDAKPIVKTDIDVVLPKIAFVLDNVLSPSECQYIIEQGEQLGFDNLQHYTVKYRGNVRILVQTRSLSDVVFERISPYLEQSIDIKPSTGIHDESKVWHGKWNLDSINDMWRLCKYLPNGRFAPHFDGRYIQDNDNRSYYTFMIYLSGGLEGGATRFLEYNAGMRNAENKVLARIIPKPGSVLVFMHDIYHDGETVENGDKYIIRTDVMYKRAVSTNSESMLENEREARKLAAEAVLLEKTDATGAASLFRKAFKLFPALQEEF